MWALKMEFWAESTIYSEYIVNARAEDDVVVAMGHDEAHLSLERGVRHYLGEYGHGITLAERVEECGAAFDGRRFVAWCRVHPVVITRPIVMC